MTNNPISNNTVGVGEVVHSGLCNAPALRVFRDVMLKDLDLLEVKKARLSKTLQEGLDSLCKNKDIVIMPAAKGVVLWFLIDKIT